MLLSVASFWEFGKIQACPVEQHRIALRARIILCDVVSRGMDSNKEKEMLAFWVKEKIFEKSLAQRKGRKKFVFYEGPPYANGLPGIHHLEARAFKDLVARYKTMRGFFVPRKAGWDTHGLPTEMSVEKKLGIKTKREIEEKIGIERFVEEARADVFAYKKEWEDFTRRMGYWLDLKNAYVTMDNAYMEKLWGILKTIWQKKLLYDDFKVLPWCTRCGTALSSHEVALGYKKVTDTALYVKFKLKPGQKIGNFKTDNNTYILSWTTTPWTLPGNVALAVGKDVDYIIWRTERETLIIAKQIQEEKPALLPQKAGTHIPTLYPTEYVKGKDLICLSYEPLFEVPELKSEKSYKVYAADFVSASEGTGIVHTAVMYGEDDYSLSKSVGLPRFHTVDETGKFIKTLTYNFAGKYVKDPETEKQIIDFLKEKGNRIFSAESYEHDYPFCWRCDSPLLYYARHGWWIAMTKLRIQLLANNKRINWFPSYLKEGRFGKWLREVKDWAISRERYWGLPLPIWECQSCRHHEVIGSLADFDKKTLRAPRTFLVMRHGEANHNVNGMTGPATPEHDVGNHLTKRGRLQVMQSAKKLKKIGIDCIVTSPLTRAQETAAIVAVELKAPIEIHDRIYDYDVGDWHNKSVEETDRLLPLEYRFEKPFPGGESLRDVRIRMVNALQDILKKYSGKTILLISHGDPLWVLNAGLEGIEEKKYHAQWYPKTGEVKRITLHNWPYSHSRGELDLHRPSIDEISLKCPRCGGEARRVKEVVDVWFDSGAMPFAAGVAYPADFIGEAIDQTRGWFYTLLAVATALGKGAPYKNVLTLEFVLDEKGKKMSKSRGNIVKPMPLMEKYGADAARWYFFTINQPWDSKLFSESDVARSRNALALFWNSFLFLKMYTSKIANCKLKIENLSLLDKWILARLNEVAGEMTRKLDVYDIVDAARALETFMGDDLSRWYIRRSRDRFKRENQDAKIAAEVLRTVLQETAKLLASFAPFMAEAVYQGAGGKKKSVHLEDWVIPLRGISIYRYIEKGGEVLLKEMKEARKIVAEALEARAQAGIKVRQPLAALKIKNQELRIKNQEFLSLIKKEVNVHEIFFDDGIKEEVEIDTIITPALKEEGEIRELMRLIQDARKKAGLKPGEKASLEINIPAELAETAKRKKEMLAKETNITQHSMFRIINH